MSKETAECVTFCPDCPFSNGITEASLDAVGIMTAYGDYFDSEGRRSLTFSNGLVMSGAVYVGNGRDGAFGSGDSERALHTVVEGITACEEPVAIRGLLRTRTECGAFYNPDGTKKARVIEVRRKRHSYK